MPMSLYLYQY